MNRLLNATWVLALPAVLVAGCTAFGTPTYRTSLGFAAGCGEACIEAALVERPVAFMPAPAPAPVRRPAAPTFAEADWDADNRLSLAEASAAGVSLSRADTNDDGVLSESEYDAVTRELRAHLGAVAPELGADL